jgi:hypothetical protein
LGIPLLALAATAVGAAIQIDDGEYHPTRGGACAIALITLAIAAAGVAISRPIRLFANRAVPPAKLKIRHGFLTIATLFLLLVIQLLMLLFSRPDSQEHPYVEPAWLHLLNLYHIGVALGLLVAMLWAALLSVQRATAARIRATSLVLAAELVIFAVLGAGSIAGTRVAGSDLHPHIDVYVFQQQAARALLGGRGPYAIDNFPDIYADAAGRPRQQVYGPGMSDGRVLRFGFPYLPASLYLATLGYAAAGDFRAAQLAAMVVSALLVYRAKPGITSALAAALLLFTPRAFFILISGWTEPFLVLWMSAAVYCACRRPALLPIALGLLLATKQYTTLAVLPATILLVPQNSDAHGWRGLLPRWGEWLKLVTLAGAVAFIVSAPLAFWDFRKFYFSVITVQRYAPFRWDALSYLTWHAFGHGEPSPASTVMFPGVMAAAAIVVCLWRAPRTPAGFAAAVGLIMLVFFAFSKQAFANYYYFVIGALACAVAVSGRINKGHL